MAGYLASTWSTDISPDALDTMRDVGNFEPLGDGAAGDRQIKGYTSDCDGRLCKTYWSSTELRAMATHFVEVAEWLDKRAEILAK